MSSYLKLTTVQVVQSVDFEELGKTLEWLVQRVQELPQPGSEVNQDIFNMIACPRGGRPGWFVSSKCDGLCAAVAVTCPMSMQSQTKTIADSLLQDQIDQLRRENQGLKDSVALLQAKQVGRD